MNTEILGVVFMFLLTVGIAIPFGKYCSKVFSGEKTWLDFFAPVKRLIFKLSGIEDRKSVV